MMRVTEQSIDRLVPYARNPRDNAQAVDKVAASIAEFGWKQPIVVDSKMVVVAGHTRLLAAQKLGMKKAPVIIANDLTPNQIKAYRLADNRIAQDSQWDEDLLKLELGDLDGEDFNLYLTGFEDDELDALLNYTGASDGEDDVPPVQDVAVSVTGDVWVLGKHRLLCGDCTVATDVERLLGDVVPVLMVTDPPYGVNYDPDWRNRAEGVGGWGDPKKAAAGYKSSQALGLVSNDDRKDWSEAYSLFPGDVVYCWHPPGANSIDFGMSLQKSGFELRMQIIWAKQHAPIGRGHYHVKHEPCWYAVRKSRNGHWSGSRKETTLWQIDKPMKSETGHSTQKPVECMARPMINNSSPGQAVYDPFMGSGTTIIAGEKESRQVFGIEINPLYVDVAVRRWQEYTGKEAKLETGETFAEIERGRKTD